jgi:glycosyltransferase involved in cell wall biosynthesis
MTVLFCFPWGLDDLGGAQISVSLLADALLRRGHRVGVVEMASRRSLQFARRFAGCVWTVPVLYAPRHPWSWRGFVASTYRFQRIVRAFRPNIVSVQSPARQSLAIIGAHVLPHRWRLVVTARAESEIRAETAEDRWLQVWLGRLLKRADAVTAVSEALLHDLIALYPFVRPRSLAIHNGVDPSWFVTPEQLLNAPQERYVLYVGRLDFIKGVDVLLRAWQQVRTRAPEIALWLAGDGSELEDLRALAQRLDLTRLVRFLGRIPTEDLPALYRGADLVVMPSRRRSEGLPRVLLEAGASGAICIATSVGGVPEVIEDAVTGFSVEPESEGALADAILRGLQLSDEQRRAMRTAARKRIADRFSHERTAAAYEELFQSLLGASRGGFGSTRLRAME